jgi:hypothetical protein
MRGWRPILAALVVSGSLAAAGTRLDAPMVSTHGNTLASFGGSSAAVHVTWRAVPGAKRYHVIWVAPGQKPAETWSTALSFQKEKLAAGHYSLTIAAMDEGGVDGVPQTLAFDVIDVNATPPGKQAPEPPTRGTYPIGTVFGLPGTTCTIGGMSDERVKTDPTLVRAARPGLATLHCGDKLDAPIVIAPVRIATTEPPVPRGDTTTVHVIVATVGSVGEQLAVTGIGGAKTAGELKRTPFGLDVPLAIAPDAETAAVAVSANGLELGRTGFDLYDKPPPPPPPEAESSAAFALDLAFAGGTFLPTATGTNMSAPAIGHPTASRDVIDAGAMFGARFGLYLVPRVGLETEGDILTVPSNGTRIAALGWRGQFAFRVAESRYIGARLIAGGGIIRPLQDNGTLTQVTSGEVHYGVGVALVTTPGVSLRADALDVVTTARDRGYSHNLELELAVVARFGRHDRW